MRTSGSTIPIFASPHSMDHPKDSLLCTRRLPGSLPPPENRAGFRTSLRWMDPDLKPQMAHNWLLGIQRELTTNLSVEIDYTGSAGRRIGTLTAINRFTRGRSLTAGTMDITPMPGSGTSISGRTGINPIIIRTDRPSQEVYQRLVLVFGLHLQYIQGLHLCLPVGTSEFD